MDNAQKAIMIGVGLFITIIVIAAVMLITGMGQDLLNSGTSQLTGMSESLRTQLFDQYDGKTLTGYQVKTACSDLFARNESGLKINIEGTEVKNYAAAKSSLSTNLSKKYPTTVTIVSDEGTVTIDFGKKTKDNKPGQST